jgi:hypothetical protein
MTVRPQGLRVCLVYAVVASPAVAVLALTLVALVAQAADPWM